MSLSPKETNEVDLKNGHVESQAVTSKPGFGQKFKRHCARFWWLHIIIFCIIFLIIALCLVYVGLPRIAQHDVDRSSLEFTELQFLDPTPDSVTLTQRAILRNPSRFTPTLDSFPASLFLVTNGTVAAKRMLTITLPEIHATKTSTQVIDGQKLNIEDVDELTQFATQVLESEEVSTQLQGKTKLHLGALPVTNVNYKETTTFKGLNGLKGFNVTGARVNLAAASGQPNLAAFAYIPNPSVMTIAMGNVTLTVRTAKAGVVGETQVLNMTLKPGNNTLPMTGNLNQTALLASVNSTGFVDLLITGKEAIYNGEHLTYYEKALASTNLTLPMNVRQVVADSLAAASSGSSTATHS